MNWQQTVFYCVLTIMAVIFLYNACSDMGVFKWVDRKLNK